MMLFRAMIVDAYRELNSKKLFWITLILSGLVVAAFAAVGIDETGLNVLWWEIPLEFLNTDVIAKDTFYKTLFVNFGIAFWLAWIATILALISTAGMFPDFMSSGTIDLQLSKPVRRITLFALKYVAGLLFVALQIAVFSGASFLVLGLRGGTWEPGIFLSIPVVVIFYSYLFSICVLFGVLTRSTIASLMLTILVWFMIFAIHATESSLLMFKLGSEQKIERLEESIERDESRITELRENGNAIQKSGIPERQVRVMKNKDDLEESTETLDKLEFAHNISYAAKTVLPKTAETIGLLERWLIDMAELPSASDRENGESEDANLDEFDFESDQNFNPDPERMEEELIGEIRSRSVFWVMGTSLLFEMVMLAVAAWVFVRRDF